LQEAISRGGMKKKREPSLRFEYFYFDPHLFYDPTRSESSNQEHFLETQLGSNLSGWYRKEFEKGNEEAIFEYAKESRVCFQAPWVTDQIEKWKIENSPESRKKLKRLFRVYMGKGRGRIPLHELQEVIKRDQKIFHEIIKLKKKFPQELMEGIVERVARRLKPKDPNLKIEETIWLVYKKYKEVADTFTGKAKIYAQIIGSSKKVYMGRDPGGGKFKDDMEFIEYLSRPLWITFFKEAGH
jgi:hypothetical protein